MTWQLPDSTLRVYPRNPLEVVIVQLRFEPILSIGTKVATFQEAVRSRFELYEENDVQLFHIEAPTASVQVRSAKQHRFVARDNRSAAVLDDQSVAIELRAHRERDDLLKDAELVFGALTSVYSPVNSTRLGLRYVNVIDRERISRDLQRDVQWNELIVADFLRAPAGLATLEGTRFGVEYASTMASGAMTLRYGLLPTQQGGIAYRFDVDRFIETSVPTTEASTSLRMFADDIYKAFCAARGPALTEWMERI